MKTKSTLILFMFLLLLSPLYSQLRLPKLISDGMILQRDTKVKIWGWSSVHETVSIKFLEKIYKTKADKNGNWSISLPKLKPGGPHNMTIKSGVEITIKNILIGDVWLCSGQSNMELSMQRVSPIYEKEIAESENPNIRQFTIPQKYDFVNKRTDFESGEWISSNPNNVLKFSAVAYFFANELYKKNKVPIGIINASLGGSPIESWMSAEALKSFPIAYKEAVRFRDPDVITNIERSDKTKIDNWYGKLWQNDEGYKNPEKPWFDNDLNTSDWKTMILPSYWKNTELSDVNGSVWFRKEINLPKSMTDKPAKLILGRIVDADSAFVNGVFVGTISYQYPPRRYNVPHNLLKEGKNVITVRVISNIGVGGFVPDKAYILYSGSDTINLQGEWKYKLGAKMEPLAQQTFVRWKPTGLFNAMINPLLNYSIKGVAWYQGESNALRYKEYLNLFSTMTKDWRKRWKIGNFPLLYVQLPNYGDILNEPSDGAWAYFREEQLKALSVIPNSAMIVSIDSGEWNDIHPLNKKVIGIRLALAAQKIAYADKKIVHSGPIYKSMIIKNNKIILQFSHIGSGLVAKGGELKEFAIKGKGTKFIWAKAIIENDRVIVWSDEIADPVAVRYAWADSPKNATLYNKEGLPASPFRTDIVKKYK